ncbi:helix-turn-helix domain-containing protein [Bailinhaonella thermotolerans]|uniref:XRE family transcriptional regulator n=1 Tax=Bailinhaonella thermotolerans TaxID=1070861 RepID=A0A3A4APE6_9ACTN|nr:helix-turn-helix domain-containing protein [Bailinhaonella thermotolerans]RJL30901.1 XRE family transcriptional regulator [Bailinhaonella thermotolerans]
MGRPVPNLRLRAWRNTQHLTREGFANAINRTPTGMAQKLECDEERVRRWETGEVRWPRAHYRRALAELTGRPPESLGFIPPGGGHGSALIAGEVMPRDALNAEAELFDTMELAQRLQASDVGTGTLEALQEAVDLLCRAYPVTPAPALRARAVRRLAYVDKLLSGRVTLAQHRELLVIAGWLTALLGCVHYDLGEREEAEASRRTAYNMGREAGHGELMGWAHEMAAWFALTEGRYEDVVAQARAGQDIAGPTSAQVQLTLQEARGLARLGDRGEADRALARGADVLATLPLPSNPDHHFVFDHSKWIFYAATCYAWLGDDDRAEEHALETIDQHTRPDGTSNAPMRMADAHIDLGMVYARRGELEAAVDHGMTALDFERRSLVDLVNRAGDLDRILRRRYRREQLAQEFHDRCRQARHAMNTRRPHLLG